MDLLRFMCDTKEFTMRKLKLIYKKQSDHNWIFFFSKFYFSDKTFLACNLLQDISGAYYAFYLSQ